MTDPRVAALAVGAAERGRAPAVSDDLPRPVVSGEARRRSGRLDALRGVAVLAMVVDHVARFADVPELRLTVGRVAMPLFFLLAGHLARRVSWRLLWIGLLGLLLPSVAPWIDNPNVLLYLALFCPLIVLLRRRRVLLLAGAAYGLTLGANGYLALVGSGYAPAGLLGLMCLGALASRADLERLRWSPRWLQLAGRYPLTLYVGHVLILTAVLA
jgi:hypothetical protein